MKYLGFGGGWGDGSWIAAARWNFRIVIINMVYLDIISHYTIRVKVPISIHFLFLVKSSNFQVEVRTIWTSQYYSQNWIVPPVNINKICRGFYRGQKCGISLTIWDRKVSLTQLNKESVWCPILSHKTRWTRRIWRNNIVTWNNIFIFKVQEETGVWYPKKPARTCRDPETGQQRWVEDVLTATPTQPPYELLWIKLIEPHIMR